eukprot:CAMPEP_0184551984 /NCGR_PEP_ID=MMETSP0199_2-20130426/27331_1 /TAXON_ID=1112570 /ORGANISM="Thraustochytrium sp., Strain LLF1b" /LENGTH=39 /DNA_ID= /DNA_START= /DNA_END= /DNA_ORIENTATION=
MTSKTPTARMGEILACKELTGRSGFATSHILTTPSTLAL